MVRTIIQLSEAQAKALKERAKEQGVSVSELARQGVDMLLRTKAGNAEIRRRAMEAVGFISDKPDLSVHHDRYLAESYPEEPAQ
jgi:hypothetical protein